MATSNFKVIVVGGGPIGLMTAHALSKSKIDYVVLEKGEEIAPTNGSGHMIFPNTLRFWDQIGILSKVVETGKPVFTKSDFLADGRSHGAFDVGQLCIDNHGYGAFYFQRCDLIQALYDTLPEAEKSNIKTSSKATKVEVIGEGVRVTLANGNVEEGSVAIGCDGVYSQVRQTILNLANTAGQGKGKKLAGLPYKSNIRSYIFRRDWPSPDKDCVMWETRSKGFGVQGIIQKNSLIVALFQRLDTPVEGYNRYSDEDKEAFKKQFVDIHLNDSLTVGEVMQNDKINWDFFADQEEGQSDILQFGGRIVLAGDSFQKITPISGLGLNMGIQQSIALVNRISSVASTESVPSAAALEKAFGLAQKDCAESLANCLTLNTVLGDGLTWANWLSQFVDRMIAPLIGSKTIVTKFYCKDIFRHGRVLDSLPKDGLKHGKIPWLRG